MGDVYMFADETGNLDYNVSGGGSKYFGIGTATGRASMAPTYGKRFNSASGTLTRGLLYLPDTTPRTAVMQRAPRCTR
jgi:hypothetical protein